MFMPADNVNLFVERPGNGTNKSFRQGNLVTEAAELTDNNSTIMESSPPRGNIFGTFGNREINNFRDNSVNDFLMDQRLCKSPTEQNLSCLGASDTMMNSTLSHLQYLGKPIETADSVTTHPPAMAARQPRFSFFDTGINSNNNNNGNSIMGNNGNDTGKRAKRTKVQRLRADAQKNVIDPEKEPNYIGRMDVDDILVQLGEMGAGSEPTKQKKSGKKKSAKAKNAKVNSNNNSNSKQSSSPASPQEDDSGNSSPRANSPQRQQQTTPQPPPAGGTNNTTTTATMTQVVKIVTAAARVHTTHHNNENGSRGSDDNNGGGNGGKEEEPSTNAPPIGGGIQLNIRNLRVGVPNEKLTTELMRAVWDDPVKLIQLPGSSAGSAPSSSSASAATMPSSVSFVKKRKN